MTRTDEELQIIAAMESRLEAALVAQAANPERTPAPRRWPRIAVACAAIALGASVVIATQDFSGRTDTAQAIVDRTLERLEASGIVHYEERLSILGPGPDAPTEHERWSYSDPDTGTLTTRERSKCSPATEGPCESVSVVDADGNATTTFAEPIRDPDTGEMTHTTTEKLGKGAVAAGSNPTPAGYADLLRRPSVEVEETTYEGADAYEIRMPNKREVPEDQITMIVDADSFVPLEVRSPQIMSTIIGYEVLPYPDNEEVLEIDDPE